MEEVDLNKCEKVGSEKAGCIAGQHVFDKNKTKLQVSGGTTTLISMKCLLCGSDINVDVNWEDKDSPGNTGINDLVQKYENEELAQTQEGNDKSLGDEFWKRIMGK